MISRSKSEELEREWRRACNRSMVINEGRHPPGTRVEDKSIEQVVQDVQRSLVNCSNWFDLLMQRMEMAGRLDDEALGAFRQTQWRMMLSWIMLVVRFQDKPKP